MGFKNIKVDVTVCERDFLYNNWRDWFIITKPKPKVYKTEAEIYLNEIFIHKMLFPINLKTLDFRIDAEIISNITLTSLKFIIPEMSIVKEQQFDSPMKMSIGDNVSVSYKLEFGS